MTNTTDWRDNYTDEPEADPRDVDWFTPASPDFEVQYAQESEDEWL